MLLPLIEGSLHIASVMKQLPSASQPASRRPNLSFGGREIREKKRERDPGEEERGQ